MQIVNGAKGFGSRRYIQVLGNVPTMQGGLCNDTPLQFSKSNAQRAGAVCIVRYRIYSISTNAGKISIVAASHVTRVSIADGRARSLVRQTPELADYALSCLP